MARSARRSSAKFPIVPVAIGVTAALGALYLFARSQTVPAAPPRGGAFSATPRGFGPQDETWAPFVNTLTAGQTFKAYKGDADVPYSALGAPDRARGLILARNLQTNQQESVPLYTINRLGTG